VGAENQNETISNTTRGKFYHDFLFKLYLENNKTIATLMFEELQGFGF
jgi:hypothetical protein